MEDASQVDDRRDSGRGEEMTFVRATSLSICYFSFNLGK